MERINLIHVPEGIGLTSGRKGSEKSNRQAKERSLRDLAVYTW